MAVHPGHVREDRAGEISTEVGWLPVLLPPRLACPAALLAGVGGGEPDAWSADLGAVVTPRDQWLDHAAARALGW